MSTSDNEPLTPPRTRRLDLLGAGVSALCLVHCALLPFLVVLIPAAVVLTDLEWLHVAFALLAAPITLVVVARAVREGNQQLFVIVALVGLGALWLAAFFEGVSDHEELITIVGALLLGSAHLGRFLRQRQQRVAWLSP